MICLIFFVIYSHLIMFLDFRIKCSILRAMWVYPLPGTLLFVVVCFTVSSSRDIQEDIKESGLPSRIPQVSSPGSWLISDKIHPLLSHKTLDQGWRDWVMRGSVYLLCQLNMSAGGWLTSCFQHTLGELIHSNYQ